MADPTEADKQSQYEQKQQDTKDASDRAVAMSLPMSEMTMVDFFAGQVAAGLHPSGDGREAALDALAKTAYDLAEALALERVRRKPKPKATHGYGGPKKP
jgi:hypothetical protein